MNIKEIQILPGKIYENHEEIIEQVLRDGKEYRPAVCPLDVIRGECGDCYDTCILNAFQSGGKYRYVEGIAQNPHTLQWIIHSWLTDGFVAYDPTWKAMVNGVEVPLPVRYIGIEMDRFLVYEFIKATEYKAILVNGYRNYSLSRKIYEPTKNRKTFQKSI